MIDPLSEVISLLKPHAVFTKGISGAGGWAVRYGTFGHPSFCSVLEGSCQLAVDGEEPLTLEAGDFVLLPTTPGFTLSGFEPTTATVIDPLTAAAQTDEVRHGTPDGPASVRLLGGYFIFASDDSELLVSLLPGQVHVRGAQRLSTLMALLTTEAEEEQPGREFVLERLVEIVLVEALRATQHAKAPAGLLRGLGDARLAQAIRQMHGDPARPWTIAELAKQAALSRSSFFERFTQNVGLSPIEYLVGWRMALAKDLLRQGKTAIAEIAERVGYGSASTFSTAFRRFVGQPPGSYAKEWRARQGSNLQPQA